MDQVLIPAMTPGFESQIGQAVAVAQHAATVPAYAAEWRLAPGDITAETWTSLPVLSKQQMVTAAAERPPYGGRLAVNPADIGWVFVAPGPLYMPFTPADMGRVAVAYGQALTSCGFSAGDLVDQTLLYNWVIAATMIDRGLAQVGCGIVPGGPGRTEQHADVICAAGVTAVIAMPSFLEHLLKAIGGRSNKLAKAVILGELSDAGAKARIADTYGIQVRELYGMADIGAIAYECQSASGMHLRDDLLVEFLDPQSGQPVLPAKDRPAEIVVTDFEREAMPVVRLSSGDLIDELDTTTCDCGSATPRIRRIIGRASDITKVRGLFVVPGQVTRVLRNRGIAANHCVVVDRKGGRDILQVLVEGPPSGDAHAIHAALEHEMRLRLELLFNAQLPEPQRLLHDRRTFQA